MHRLHNISVTGITGEKGLMYIFVFQMLEMENKGRAQNQVKNSDSEENLGKSRDHNLLLTGVSCFGFAGSSGLL